jgi:hypothetical protein
MDKVVFFNHEFNTKFYPVVNLGQPTNGSEKWLSSIACDKAFANLSYYTD